MHDFYGVEKGVPIARKHIGAYLAKMYLGQYRTTFNRLETAKGQLDMLAHLAETYSDEVEPTLKEAV